MISDDSALWYGVVCRKDLHQPSRTKTETCLSPFCSARGFEAVSVCLTFYTRCHVTERAMSVPGAQKGGILPLGTASTTAAAATRAQRLA